MLCWCRYHWDHHLRINYNYSEIEFLDAIFGTLYVHSTELTANTHRGHPEPPATTAPAEQQQQPRPVKAPPSPPPQLIKRPLPSTPPTASKPRRVAMAS